MNVQKEQPSFFPNYRSSNEIELKVVLLFVVLCLLLRFDILAQFPNSYLGGFSGDGGLYVWLTSRSILDSFSNGFFNTEAFYPYTRTLAWSDNYLLPTLIVNIFQTVGLPHTVAYNLLLIIAQIANGYITYRLAFLLSGYTLPSILSGIVFMNLSYLTYATGHPQLQFAFLLPLGLIILFSYLRAWSKLVAVSFGLLVTAAFLTTVYYALFLVILAAVFWLSLKILRSETVKLRTIFNFAIYSLIGVSPTLLFIIPYLDIRDIFGNRAIFEAYYFSASSLSYISSSPWQYLYSGTSSLTHGEAHLFPGLALYILMILALFHLFNTKKINKETILTLGLFLALTFFASSREQQYLSAIVSWTLLIAVVSLVNKVSALEKRLRVTYISNRAIISILLLIATVFFLITLGPLGNPEKDQYALGIYRVFYEFVPGFSSLRAISRAGLVVLLALCLLVPFALMKFRKHKQFIHITIAICGIILVENLNRYYPIEPAKQPPNILGANEFTTDSVTAFLPMTSEIKGNGTVKSWSDFAAKNVTYMNWANSVGTMTINGYSGQRSSIMKEYPRKLSGFPDNRSIASLSFIPNLNTIYVNSAQGAELIEQANRFSELKLLSSDDEGNLLFSFDPKNKLSDDFYLRVPSYPHGGSLNLELQALYEPEQPKYKLQIFENDHYSGKELISYTVPADGSYHTYKLELPEPTERARPFRIKFKADKKASIYLRKRIWKRPN